MIQKIKKIILQNKKLKKFKNKYQNNYYLLVKTMVKYFSSKIRYQLLIPKKLIINNQ